MKLIVKVNCNASTKMMQEIRQNIIHQITDGGVVVLPSFCSYEILDDTDVQVEVIKGGKEDE